MTAITDELVRAEVVVYRNRTRLERIGPIVVRDETNLERLKRSLADIAEIQESEIPHALFTVEDEVFVTLVYRQVAQARIRIVGPMAFLFDDERHTGLFQSRRFELFVEELADKHSQSSPADQLTVKNKGTSPPGATQSGDHSSP